MLAGVETASVDYLPLTKEIVTFGTVEFNETKQRHIAARQKARIVKLFVNYTGQIVDKGEELAVLDVRTSPELNVTLEDLLRARKSGNKELEEMSKKRLALWDIGDEQIQEFLRTGKPGVRLRQIPLHALRVVIEDPQIRHRGSITRVGRLGKPVDAGGEVGRFPFASQQHHRHIELRQPVALPCGGIVRGERSGVVPAPIRLPSGVGCRLERRRRQCRRGNAGHRDCSDD